VAGAARSAEVRESAFATYARCLPQARTSAIFAAGRPSRVLPNCWGNHDAPKNQGENMKLKSLVAAAWAALSILFLSGCNVVIQAPADQSTDRKSTRLNSSHVAISYAVFCLKKKKK